MYCVYNLDTLSSVKEKANKRTFLHYLSSGCRASTVLPFMEGMSFNLYNGRKTKSINIVRSMFGYKLGSLITNKEICVFKRKQNKKKGKTKGKAKDKSKSVLRVIKKKQTKQNSLSIDKLKKQEQQIVSFERAKTQRRNLLFRRDNDRTPTVVEIK